MSTTEGLASLVGKLESCIAEIDSTQRSIDEIPKERDVSAAFVTLADSVYVASEALEYFEATDHLPEAVRENLFTLLRGAHHMLLTLHMRSAP